MLRRAVACVVLGGLIGAGAPAAAATQSAECAHSPCTVPDVQAPAPLDIWTAASQIHQLKLEFVDALREFTRAQAGTFGDEGSALRSSLEAMRRALGRWDRAIAEFETALAPVRRSDEVLVALGTVYLDRLRPKEALRELASAERLNPKRPDIYTLQALAFGLSGSAADAVRVLRAASALDAANPAIAYRLARGLARLGLDADAEEAWNRFSTLALRRLQAGTPAVPFERVYLLRQASGVAPLFPVALYSDGYAALDAGDYRKAMSLFGRAVERDPLTRAAKPVKQRAARAGAALRTGDVASALGELREAAAAVSDEAEVHRVLGVAYSIAEQHRESIEHLATAVRLDPQNERAHVALVEALVAAGRRDDAERQIGAAAARFPRSGRLQYRLGELLLSAARYPEAAAAFEASLALGPIVGKDHLLQTIGSLYVNQAEFDRAAGAYARRVEVNPNSADAHRRLAEIHDLQGRNPEALAEFAAAALLDPKDARAFAGIGQVQLRLTQYAAAADALTQAVARGGGDAATRYALGICLMRLDRETQGRQQLEWSQRLRAEAIAAGRREFEVGALRRQAMDARAAGRHEEAVAALRQAVALDPQAAASRRALGQALLEASLPAEAIEHLTIAQALEPAPDLHDALAAAYRALGNEAEATRHRAAGERLVHESRLKRIRDLAGAP